MVTPSLTMSTTTTAIIEIRITIWRPTIIHLLPPVILITTTIVMFRIRRPTFRLRRTYVHRISTCKLPTAIRIKNSLTTTLVRNQQLMEFDIRHWKRRLIYQDQQGKFILVIQDLTMINLFIRRRRRRRQDFIHLHHHHHHFILIRS